MTRARDLARIISNNAITVSATNNVGIGNSLPISKLDVGGELLATGADITGTSQLENVLSTSVDSTFLKSSGITTVGSLSSGPIVASNGNLSGILTTSVGTLGSNGNGTRTVQSGGSPTGGVDGDIYYIY